MAEVEVHLTTVTSTITVDDYEIGELSTDNAYVKLDVDIGAESTTIENDIEAELDLAVKKRLRSNSLDDGVVMSGEDKENKPKVRRTKSFRIFRRTKSTEKKRDEVHGHAEIAGNTEIDGVAVTGDDITGEVDIVIVHGEGNEKKERRSFRTFSFRKKKQISTETGHCEHKEEENKENENKENENIETTVAVVDTNGMQPADECTGQPETPEKKEKVKVRRFFSFKGKKNPEKEEDEVEKVEEVFENDEGTVQVKVEVVEVVEVVEEDHVHKEKKKKRRLFSLTKEAKNEAVAVVPIEAEDVSSPKDETVEVVEEDHVHKEKKKKRRLFSLSKEEKNEATAVVPVEAEDVSSPKDETVEVDLEIEIDNKETKEKKKKKRLFSLSKKDKKDEEEEKVEEENLKNEGDEQTENQPEGENTLRKKKIHRNIFSASTDEEVEVDVNICCSCGNSLNTNTHHHHEGKFRRTLSAIGYTLFPEIEIKRQIIDDLAKLEARANADGEETAIDDRVRILCQVCLEQESHPSNTEEENQEKEVFATEDAAEKA